MKLGLIDGGTTPQSQTGFLRKYEKITVSEWERETVTVTLFVSIRLKVMVYIISKDLQTGFLTTLIFFLVP